MCRVTNWNSFPIPKMSDSRLEELSNLARQVMELKCSGQGTETTTLEENIDQIVYLLYDLTPEEIAIVEENTV